MSTQQLSDACAGLGLPVARSVLANFETGRRPTVSVPEVFVLAQALDVPPILLLCPLGHADTVEVSPGREMPTWDALKWFAGRGAPDTTDWRESAVSTQLWEEHENALSAWQEAPGFMTRAQDRGGVPTEDARRLLEASRKGNETALRAIRAQMRSLGLTPPRLPEDLEHVDQSNRGGM